MTLITKLMIIIIIIIVVIIFIVFSPPDYQRFFVRCVRCSFLLSVLSLMVFCSFLTQDVLLASANACVFVKRKKKKKWIKKQTLFTIYVAIDYIFLDQATDCKLLV